MLRLVEHVPAWELHALLRFCDVNYRVDYSPLPTALGKTLPVLVDECGIHSGSDIFQCIYSHSKKSFLEDELVLDELVSGALQQRFQGLWAQLRHRTSTYRDESMRASSWGVNVYLGHLLDLQRFFASNRFDPVPVDTEEKLIEKLFSQYTKLDEMLSGPQSTIRHAWPTINSVDEHHDESHHYVRLLSDALLFGFILQALTIPELSAKVSQLSQLNNFVSSIALMYFRDNDSSADDSSWQISLYRLLQNPFVTHNPLCEHVRTILAFEDVDEMSALSYFSHSDASGSVRDESTELVLPTLPDWNNDRIFPWQHDRPAAADGVLLSVPGLVFAGAIVVAMAFNLRR